MPIVVIPQIILAGVIAPLKGLAEILAKGLVSVYWGLESLKRVLPGPDLELIGLEAKPWPVPLGVVFIQALACAIVTVVALRLVGGPEAEIVP